MRPDEGDLFDSASFCEAGGVFAQQWELNDWRRGAINVERPEPGWESQQKLSH